MTREEWLRKAVELINTELFEGDLDIINHDFQISCGRCPGNKLTDTIQPYDGEDVSLDDFFPTTITISHTIKDIETMLGNIARECIFAFFNEKKVNKRVKKLFEKYYFEKPYTTYNPSPYLESVISNISKMMIKQYGEFPGKAVVIYPKPKKEGKKSTIKMFCPECGFEANVKRKLYEKHGQGKLTCVCGCKMGIDLEEDEKEQ